MMQPLTDLDLWEMAKDSHSRGDVEQTMGYLKKLGRSARALYNRAMLSEDPKLHLEECLECDSYLAIGHFRLAQFHDEVCNKPDEAIKCYRACLASFREAPYIDYTQLGMPLRLTQSSVLYNLGLVQLGGVDRGAGLRCLVSAHHQSEDEAERSRIEEAIASLGADAQSFRPAKDLLFWPAPDRQSPSFNLDPLIFDDPQVAFDSIRHRRSTSIASIMSQAKRTVVDDSWVPSGSPSNYSHRSSFDLVSLVKVAFTKGAEFVNPEYRIFKLEQSELEPLRSSLGQRFGHERLRVKYRDETGDWIVLVDEDDLKMAMEADSMLRLWCYPN